MGLISWEHLGAVTGEQFEDIIAVLLKQKIENIRQISPGKGDKGVDLIQECAGGAIIWQIKKFMNAPTTSQFKQIKKSWNRFKDEYLSINPKVIIGYRLLTPWNPTIDRLKDFDDMTKDAIFQCRWLGKDYIDGVYAEFPHIIDAALKGPAYLEGQIMAKAVLASSTIEKAEAITMIQAYSQRFLALTDIGDKIVPGHLIDQGTLTTKVDLNDETFIALSKNSAGVMHEYSVIDRTRVKYQSIVPDPKSWRPENALRLNAHFSADLSVGEKEKLDDWYKWGKPYRDVTIDSLTVTGDDHVFKKYGLGTISLYLDDDNIPENLQHAFEIVIQKKSGKKYTIPLELKERTRGANKTAFRLKLTSQESILELEILYETNKGNSLQHGKIGLCLDDDRVPKNVFSELSALGKIATDDTLMIALKGSPFIEIQELLPVKQIEYMRHLAKIAKALTIINKRNKQELPFPNTQELTPSKVQQILELGSVYSNNGYETSWSTGQINFRIAPSELELPEGGVLVLYYYPKIKIGNRTFTLKRPVRELVAGIDVKELKDRGKTPGKYTINAVEGKGRITKIYVKPEEIKNTGSVSK